MKLFLFWSAIVVTTAVVIGLIIHLGICAMDGLVGRRRQERHRGERLHVEPREGCLWWP
jgi:hypothetical protein